ncbi:MAG: polysaccharide biosynthesis tyrosine autokinase [Chloroherpetonaceae bacterium]|nr:polysaccharide biosynthesis tyrosine autokinase [Chthonomonadaceae bacterium]MDW8208693.1 polysaccharide biosynthesis tyrosine autokinase [Chloroherpetonaceae bacterium]
MLEENVAQNEVTLREYLDLLRRRKAVIIQTFLAVLIIGIIVAYVSRPVYRSTGRLLVQPQISPINIGRNLDDPLSQLVQNRRVHSIETQMQVLMTPDLLNKAYSRAGVSLDDKRIRVDVSPGGENVDIIDISTEAHSPAIAEAVTNNLITLYIQQTKDWLLEDIEKSIRFARQELDAAKREWEEAARKLNDYQRKKKLTDYTTQIQSQTAMVAELERKETTVKADLEGLRASIATMRDELRRMPGTIEKVTVASNITNRDRLQEELTKLEANYEGNLQIYKPEHAKMKALQKQMESIRNRLKNMPETVRMREETTNPELRQMEEKLRNLLAQEAGYVASLAEITGQRVRAEARLRELSSAQYEQARLKQDSEIAQTKYKLYADKLDNLLLQRSAQPTPVQELVRASLNPVPVRPNRMLIIAMAAVAGLFLGVCFALLQEFLDDRVNAPEDARRLLGIPALGYIPRVERPDMRLLTADRSGGSLLESYRVLRSNVRFAAVGEPLNSIMVTSTAPGEGKSMTSCNLAIAMALDGKRVILVDADLRRPTVHEKFGIRNTPGLTNVLVGALPLDRALQDTDIENLQILASGPLPPNPAELLNSNSMLHVQQQLKQRADVVIYDTPPCLSVADAQVMSSNVDGVIYVVQLGSTRKSALRHGFELLRQAQARVLGIVYNKVQVDGKRSDYYYGYYSYYHKAELPSKATSKSKNGQSEWEALVAQGTDNEAPAAIAASDNQNTAEHEEKA